MNEGAAFRGQPLLLLGGLLIGWTALRIMMWQSPSGSADVSLNPFEAAQTRVERAEIAAVPDVPLAWLGARRPAGTMRAHWIAPKSQSSGPVTLEEYTAVALPPNLEPFANHDLITPGVPAAAPPPIAAMRPPTAPMGHWSADGWLLVRDDTVTPIVSGRPSYGRSQAGALVRYAFDPASSHRPQAYLRASAALAGEREQEVAIGLSARPLGVLPVRVAIEGRLEETDRGTRARPAAYAVTELPQFRLPAGVRAEIYAQAGYVGGAFATAFADGQAHVGRPVTSRDGIELSVGLGAWGGAQEGASRLDVGPTAIVSFRLGKGFGRIAADYRLRAAGNAEPKSGLALTVSAGF